MYQENLAADLGVDARTIKRIVTLLREKGCVEVERVPIYKGPRMTNKRGNRMRVDQDGIARLCAQREHEEQYMYLHDKFELEVENESITFAESTGVDVDGE